MTTKFYKEKIALQERVSELLFNEIDFTIGRNSDDFVKGMFTMQLNAFVLSRINERLTIRVCKPRPTLWEWLTRKPRVFDFVFIAREVLKKPPQLEAGQSVLLYDLKTKQDHDSD